LIPRGIDLGTEWRARRWRRLLNLIDRLPRNSAYIAAVAADDDVADAIAQRDDGDQVGQRRELTDWTADVELLSMLYDRVGELIQATVASRGVRPTRLQPAPRPVTALERARRRARIRQHDDLVARVLPFKVRPADGSTEPPPDSA
jgi:hypothetical protein